MSMTSQDRTVRELVARIDEVRSMGDKAQAVAKAFAQRESDLRTELLTHMMATDTRHALVGPISVIVRQVRKVDVTDEGALVEAITSLGLTADYTELNLSSAKADAIKNSWPGVEERFVHQLVVSRREVTA